MGRNGWSRWTIIAIISYFVHFTGNNSTLVAQSIPQKVTLKHLKASYFPLAGDL